MADVPASAIRTLVGVQPIAIAKCSLRRKSDRNCASAAPRAAGAQPAADTYDAIRFTATPLGEQHADDAGQHRADSPGSCGAHLAIDEAHAYDVNEPVRLRFGTNELDCASRRLWREGREVHLSTKAFDLLVLLVERRPAAVRKSEIKERLWPETFVSETNLPSLITEIRNALGMPAREAQFIRTVYGFGYSFSAEAVIAGTAGAAPDIDAGLARLVGPTSQITLRSGENVLGREGDEVVALLSSTVSRRHARVTLSANTATIEDLGSKNGTYVNDIRVTTPTTIADGDTIRVGSLVFTIRFAGRSASTQTM